MNGAIQMERVNRKVTKIGNSLGVTVTKDSLRKLNLKLGDEIEMVVDEEKREMVLRKAVNVPPGLQPEFFETLQTNIEKYRETIEDLKDR